MTITLLFTYPIILLQCMRADVMVEGRRVMASARRGRHFRIRQENLKHIDRLEESHGCPMTRPFVIKQLIRRLWPGAL